MTSNNKMFQKVVSRETADLEIEIQQISAAYGFSPKVLTIEHISDEETMFGMDDLDAETLFELYGDSPENTPLWIWDAIRTMVSTLYEEEGIEYPDITPYNFIEKDSRIYMIDFGDAKYTKDEPNWFLMEFLDGSNSWNPDFA